MHFSSASMSFSAAAEVEVSNITHNSSVLRWREEQEFRNVEAKQFIGYNIYLSTNGENFTLNETVAFQSSQDQWQHVMLESLLPNVSYRVEIEVFRVFTDGRTHPSPNRPPLIRFSTRSLPSRLLSI